MYDDSTAENLLFNEKSIDHLSPEKKYDMIRLKIKKLIQNHPEGLTCAAISEITGVTPRTIRNPINSLRRNHIRIL